LQSGSVCLSPFSFERGFDEHPLHTFGALAAIRH
jgi:hypothetical protein